MKWLLLAIEVMLMLQVAGTAAAQSGCELAHECGEQEARATPTGNPSMSIYAWNPNVGYARGFDAQTLMGLCQTYGGYYYLADDSSWYWFAC